MFLVSRTGDPASEAAAELADEPGGLPLALEQAGAYIQATGIIMPGRGRARYALGSGRSQLMSNSVPSGSFIATP